MHTTNGAREFWNPQSEDDRDLVRRELEALLNSSLFTGSKRYPAFLRYVIEAELAGNGDSLKERTLGVEVFHRQPDYDTNIDTVVRFAAGEVRKRLEVFYHESELAHPIQISLPTGSYVPRFLRITEPSSERLLSATVKPIEIQTDTSLSTKSRTHWLLGKHLWIPALAAVTLAAVWFAIRVYREPQQAAIVQFWKPFEESPEPVLICTGTVAFSPAHPNSPMPATRNDDYPYLSLGTATALSNVTELFGRQHVKYIAQGAPNVNLTELKSQPVVFIGAYTNPWTLQSTGNLRYRFAPEPNYEIFDSANPTTRWAGSGAVPYNSGSSDFALVARYHDPNTSNLTVVIAGLGINGTVAASTFVTSPQFLELLNHALPKDWATKNFEIVLKSNVIDYESGPPSIEAAYSW